MRPIWNRVIVVLIFVGLALASLVLYYTQNWKPIIQDKLKEIVFKASDGLYEIDFQSLSLNLSLGNLTLRDATLISDSTIYQKQISLQNAPNNRFHVKVKKLNIRGFNLLDILFAKKLSVSSIILEDSQVHLIHQRHVFNDSIQKVSDRTLYDHIKKTFSSIFIRNIILEKLKFKYTTISPDGSRDIDLQGVNMKLHDVLIDKESHNNVNRIFYSKMLDIQVPGLELALPDRYYLVRFDDLRFNTASKQMVLKGISLHPKMGKSAFYKSKKKNVTMAELSFDTVRVEGFDFKKFMDYQHIVANIVYLKGGDVKLSSDKRYPKYPVNKIGHSPHQQLIKLNRLIRLDTIWVNDVNVAYYEMSGKYHKEGSISFNQASGSITNVTNDYSKLEKNKFMHADLKAYIMGVGNLHAKFGFDMLSKVGEHTYSGTLGPMPASAFNRILSPLLNVELSSGNIKGISFNYRATDRKNWGEFRFDYDDLKLNILNKTDSTGRQSSKKIVSFLVNQILINNSNPDKKGGYHIANVNYTRVAEHTYFKTLWQSLLEGIKQCAGISPEREAKLTGTAVKGKNAIEKGKGVVQGAAKKTGKFFKNLLKKKDDAEEELKN